MVHAADLLMDGRTIKEVADELGLSEKAVEGYASEWYRELEVDDRDGFAAKWLIHRRRLDDDGRPLPNAQHTQLDLASIRYVKSVDDVSIAYAIYGEGPGTPIVCLEPPHYSHLQTEWSMDWNAQSNKLQRLAGRRRVVRYDPRGSGMSDRGVSNQSLDARVSDLEAVVARMNAKRVVLYGVRNSGLVALEFARRRPEVVSALILDECFARGSDFWNHPTHQALTQLAALDWTLFTEVHARMIYGWEPARRFPTGSAGELAMATAAYIRECMTGADFLRWADAESEVDLTEALSGLGLPTLVILYEFGGRLHPFTPRDAARSLASTIPHSEMVVVDGLPTILDRIEVFLELD